MRKAESAAAAAAEGSMLRAHGLKLGLALSIAMLESPVEA